MEDLTRYWQDKMVEPLLGPQTPESALVGQTLMAPALGIAVGAQHLRGFFKGFPNIQGAISFAGDIFGLMALHRAYRGPKTEWTAKAEEIADRAKEISKEQEAASLTANEQLAATQQKIIDAKKLQLELEAKELASKLEHGKMIAEDLNTKGRQAKIARQPKKAILDEQIDKAMQRIKDKSIIEEHFGTKQDIIDSFKKEKKPEPKPRGKGEELEEFPDIDADIQLIAAIEERYGRKIDKISDKEVEDFFLEDDPITKLDTQTGTREPIEFDTEHSPFRDTVERTEQLRDSFEQNARGVAQDVELTTSKLVNDVNRWLNGEEGIDIVRTRDGLSELAARADELKHEHFADSAFYPSNFTNWKETVRGAADWARKADRSKIEPTPTDIAVDTIMKDPDTNTLYTGVDPFRVGKEIVGDVKKIIKSWNKNHDELLVNIIDLMHGGRVDVDVNYSLGKMWAKIPESKRPEIKLDKTPQAEGVVQADISRSIPLPDASINSIISDPPFLVTGKKEGVMVKRFTGFKSLDALLEYHDGAMAEFARVLKPGGRVTIKLQDISAATGISAKHIARAKFEMARTADLPITDYVKRFGVKHGLRYISEFVYVNKKGQLAPKVGTQRIPRKAHSTFLTFEKTQRTPQRESPLLDKFGIGLKLADPVKTSMKLYSGIPLDLAGKELAKLYNKAKASGEEALGIRRFDPKLAAKVIKKGFVNMFVDKSGNIRWDLIDRLGLKGYEIIQKMYLSKGASSLSANMLNQMRDEVYGGLTRAEKKILNELIFHTRMQDIGSYKTSRQFSYFKEHPVEESIAYTGLFEVMEKLSPEQARKLYHIREDGSVGGRVGSYFDWMKKPLKDMLETELISQGEYDMLITHNYRKLKLVEDIFDRRYRSKVGARKRTVYESGVERLARGKKTDIFERNAEVMALEVFNRSYGRILNNEANRSLLDLARKQPDNPFARVRTKDHKIPSNWNKIYVFEGGERKPIYLSPEMSREWITSNPEMSYRLGQVIRYVSGSPVLRTFATGINWGFALANLPRDVMHTWFAARVYENGKWRSVYSPNSPVFAFQIGGDLMKVFHDAATKGPKYQEYIKEGGGMEFLVHQGRLFKRGRHIENWTDSFYKFFGYFGETSEIMTRLAIRERVIRRRANERNISIERARKDKDITREATFAARDYMDFGQGGGIAKAADNGIPYLNAAIQGTRGLFRAFKDNKWESTYKMAQFAGVVSGTYIASTKANPLTMEALRGNIDMQNNLVIALGDDFGFEDQRGQIRYPYLKIPLDPGQKFFKTFFEAATDKWLGNPVDIDRVIDSLKEQSPVGVTEMPPTFSAALGYTTNKDYWLNEDIWKKTDKPAKWQLPKKFTGQKYGGSEEEHFPGRTPQAYVDFGATTGLSPERTKYAIEELITSGTVWSWLAGQGYDALFSDLPKSQKEQHLAMALARTPVVKRFFGVTNPYSQFAGPIDRAKEASDIERWVQNRELDTLVEGFLYQDTNTRADVEKYIDTFEDQNVYERLFSRFEFQEDTKNLPNRAFWLRLKGLDVKARARVYSDRLNEASDEQKRQLELEMDQVIDAGGVITDRFWEEYDDLASREVR